jgi:hypothetical protein
MELARPEDIRSRDRSPEEIERAAEVCDDVLDMLAQEDADQALTRGIIDERLHLLGSVAVQSDVTQRQ